MGEGGGRGRVSSVVERTCAGRLFLQASHEKGERRRDRAEEKERDQRADPNKKPIPIHKEIPIRYRKYTNHPPTSQGINANICILSRKGTPSSGTTLRPRERAEKTVWKTARKIYVTLCKPRKRKTTTNGRRSDSCELVRCYPETHPQTTYFRVEKKEKNNLKKEPEEKGQHFPL